MSWALDAGYAVSGTDTGHSGSAGDASWAIGHPEKVVGFGWRAIHATAVAAKAVIAAFYGRDAAHAYFTGCSDGGREGLMEAQRFPEDYDGIVAGAPANNWVGMSATDVWDEQALVAGPGSSLPPAKLPAITKAVLDVCHGHNGYLDDPRQCHLNLETLLCKSGDTQSCPTAPQVETLRKIYDGRPHHASGKRLFPGFEPGGEAGKYGWSFWITGDGSKSGEGSLAIGGGFFGDMVFRNPDWDFRTMNFGGDIALAEQRMGQIINATDSNLKQFRDRGGKIIQDHGWDDAAISPLNSIAYYLSVAGQQGGTKQTQSFYRLFMAPGMRHCGLGPGPNAIGGVFGLPSVADDPRHDAVAALARWVEDNVPPDQIVATRYHDDDPAKGVAAQRPWCPYPALSRYNEHGDRTSAEAYNCENSRPSSLKPCHCAFYTNPLKD